MATKKSNDVELVFFDKAGGTSIGLPFDLHTTLDKVRVVLESSKTKHFMSSDDFFISHGSEILKDEESSISLGMVISDDHRLSIGVPQPNNPLDPKDGVQHYNSLSGAQKLSLFNNVEIFNGLTFDSAHGFHKSFKKIYTWKDGIFPDALIPRVLTEVVYTDSFSKVTHSLQETSTDSGSVSLNTPYGGGESEFKYEKSKTTSSSKVTEYITGKYLVRKASLSSDLDNLVATDEFNHAIATALHNNINNDFAACKAVLQTLNTYGYYVPKEFNLGGALFSSDSTTITEYSESTTTKQEFGGSFKAAFDGIGGGASYKHAQGSDQTTTNSNKFQITSFSQVGGRSGTSNNFNEWSKSLDKAIYWNVATFDKMFPSVALLSDANDMNKIISLFDKFNSYSGIHEVQPYINLLDYATAIQDLFGGSPWGN